MSLVNNSVYPTLSERISQEFLEKKFFVTEEEINFAVDSTRNQKTALCFLISLKIFQYLSYFIDRRFTNEVQLS
jgi:hypothetical protein